MAEYTETLNGGKPHTYTTTIRPTTRGEGGLVQHVISGWLDNPSDSTYIWDATGFSLSRYDNAKADIHCQFEPAQRVMPSAPRKGDRWQQTIATHCTSGDNTSNDRRTETAAVISTQLWRVAGIGTIMTATIRRTITDTAAARTVQSLYGPVTFPPRTTHAVQTDVIALTGGFLISSDISTPRESSSSSCSGDCPSASPSPQKADVMRNRLIRARWTH